MASFFQFPEVCENNSLWEIIGYDMLCIIIIDVFVVIQDFVIQGEKPVLWPVWFRAALPGMISVYITVYYEMGDVSSVLRYRTLRMCHSFEVSCHCISSVQTCSVIQIVTTLYSFWLNSTNVEYFGSFGYLFIFWNQLGQGMFKFFSAILTLPDIANSYYFVSEDK